MSTPSNYVLGHSNEEYERLVLQARILRPYTEKFFRAAGVTPGMRVLDLGSGVGDVALLAADIVGPAPRHVFCALGTVRNKPTALRNVP
jgi:ubiquinone/menaquinone biosynthesis C-methylase UbiE